MSSNIQEISVRKFRGIKLHDFELDSKSLLLCGDNGTGKSSLVDAIEYFFTGKIDLIQRIKDLKKADHLSHVHHSIDEVEVEMKFNSGSISIKKTEKNKVSPPEELNEYFEITQNNGFILRRVQLLEFINSEPGKKYNAIANLIGIEQLDNQELQIKQFHDNIEIKTKNSKKNLSEKEKLLKNLLGSKRIIKTEADYLKAINKKLKNKPKTKFDSISELDEFKDIIFKKTRKLDFDKKFETTRKSVVLFEEINLYSNIKNDLREMIELSISINLEKLETEGKYAKFLTDGLRLLEKEKTNSCPFCEQQIKQFETIKRLRERLQILSQLSENYSNFSKLKGLVLKDIEKRKSKISQIIDSMKDSKLFSNESGRLFEKESILENISKNVNEIDQGNYDESLGLIDSYTKGLDNIKKSVEKKIHEILAQKELTDEERAISDDIKLINDFQTHYKDKKNHEREYKNFNKKLIVAKEIYKTYSETKKKEIDTIFDSIKVDIKKYYEIIHPEEEEHQNIVLSLKSGKRASVQILMDSFNKTEVDPRAYSSEGHLDSLGICIFLAFVKKFNEPCNLIVLDDVLTTIDHNHRLRIAELLSKEFKKYQLIITTHDEIWYQSLFSAFKTEKMEAKILRQKIVDWNVETGPIIKDYLMKEEKIKKLLDDGDKDLAGNACRKYLEGFLLELAEKTETRLKFRFDAKYSEGEIYSNVVSKLKELTKKISLKEELQSSLDELDKSKFFLNLLSHANFNDISLSEVRNGFESILKFKKLVSCPECNKILTYNQTTETFSCVRPCKNPKIYSLKKDLEKVKTENKIE